MWNENTNKNKCQNLFFSKLGSVGLGGGVHKKRLKRPLSTVRK